MGLSSQVKATWLFQRRGIVRVGTNADWVAGGNFNIFNIAAGPINVYSMWGHVTVGCTGALLVPVITFTPVLGAASNICTLAVGAAHAAGTILTWSGLLAGVLAPTAGAGHGQAGVVESFDGGPILMMPGILSITNAPADATAVIDWYMEYQPVTGAAVVTVL